jgi:putative endonuclease
MVFVEVKTREGRDYGEPHEAVTRVKRRRMAQIAFDFLARQRLVDCPCRFDVVSIAFEDGQPAIELFANAFDIDSFDV